MSIKLDEHTKKKIDNFFASDRCNKWIEETFFSNQPSQEEPDTRNMKRKIIGSFVIGLGIITFLAAPLIHEVVDTPTLLGMTIVSTLIGFTSVWLIVIGISITLKD